MALDFPGSPTNGQTYTSNGLTYTYDSTYGVWKVNPIAVPDVFGVANSGYAVANAAFGNANSTLVIASAAFNASNGVYAVANAAFDKANNSASINKGIAQTLTSNTTMNIDVANGDFININMAGDISNLTFTNVATNQMVVLTLTSNTIDPYFISLNTSSNTSFSSALGPIAGNVNYVMVTNNGGKNWYITSEKTQTYTTTKLWTFGVNSYGGLGLDDLGSRSSPTQVGSLTDWRSINAGYNFTLAIKNDKTLWAWGENNNGQLGQGNITKRSSPVQVGALAEWRTISSGQLYSAALKQDNTLWVWGGNGTGQLGLGTSGSNYSTPTQVGKLYDWKQISCGGTFMAAVKTDGTLWTWGDNPVGQLGLSDTTNRSSPTQVGVLTNWSQVSCTDQSSATEISVAAIKTDGTLWTWGSNKYGQLGQGDISHRSSPVQVGVLTNWKQVSSGSGCIAAIKTDGTLWAWGNNETGKLGDGTMTHRSSPVQIGALTNWYQIACGDSSHTVAIKTDGTLWSWGNGSDGALGRTDRVDRSSPVQVGTLTNWKQVSAGYVYTAALSY